MAERLNVLECEETVLVARVVRALEVGALVVLPTETVYGLAADARRPDALARIYAVKRRDAGKPIALLADGVDSIVACGAALSPVAQRLAARFWPGALTLVLPCGGGWEGFRVPDAPLALAILRGVGGLLRVTSANASGEPAALTADAAVAALGERVELIVDGGHVSGGEASTVVKVENETVTVLRPGPITQAMLDAAV
jgi:L-threonylcarbamoyladenylate synthase